jgi:hypothetical protein
MTPRTLILTAGIAAAGYWLSRRHSDSALPPADGPVPDVGPGDGLSVADDLQRSRPAREAGMPADMSNDADRVRPGFADYARGA